MVKSRSNGEGDAALDSSRDPSSTPTLEITLPPASSSAQHAELSVEPQRYRIEELLGEGGMGQVHKAYDETKGRWAAIKVIRTPRSTSRRAPADGTIVDGHAATAVDVNAATEATRDARLERERLLREAQSMVRIIHPNVVEIYDVGIATGGVFGNDAVFIAMELLDGPTLQTWATAAPRTWHEVLTVYMQAGRGLAAAHANGVVHRDFKPENAIIGADGRVRVIDFGLAWAQSIVDTSHVRGIVELDAMHLTQAGHIVGTPLYMAPEQADGESVDARADQFAFCVALYEALFQQQPFADETIIGRLADIRRDNVTPPAGHDVPPRLVQAVLRGLHPHPKDRWATMNDLIDALEQHARRRLVFSVGVVLAVVVALAVVYAIWAAR